MCDFTHLKSRWHYFWNTMATGNMEKWCKGDQTWGIVKEKPPVLTRRKKNQMQPVVFKEMSFLFHLATPTSKIILPSLLQIHLEGPQSREVSQLSVHCILLLTRNWTFFSLISFPNLYFWNLSGWIKIDQGLLFLIDSTVWLHLTKIQTLWLSLSQHSS